MNHQGLLWNVHCVATVVLRKQLSFKSAVIRSNRSSCFKKQIDVSFLCVCPLIDDKLRHNIVKGAVEPQAASDWFSSKL